MAASFQNHHVTDQQAGLAVIAILRQAEPGKSWSEVRRLVENRHVQINGNLCVDPGRRLTPGDVIKVWHEPRQQPPRAEDVKIRYADAHLVVVEKPAGVTSVRHAEEQHWSRRRKQIQPTLEEIVDRAIARRRKEQGASRARVRPVHRLDRDTSGLLVLAVSAEAERRLVDMFRKHTVHRVYHALALGSVKDCTIQTNLVRDRGDGRRGSTNLPNVGKRAITHIRPLEPLVGYTLVECRLETGRTHQIRIHLAESGHMVCGERVYNKQLFGEPVEDPSGAQRQALHAAELGFAHPITGAPLEFKMPLPPDMARLLIKLRAAKPRGG